MTQSIQRESHVWEIWRKEIWKTYKYRCEADTAKVQKYKEQMNK
jgi:hypothetical protein